MFKKHVWTTCLIINFVTRLNPKKFNTQNTFLFLILDSNLWNFAYIQLYIWLETVGGRHNICDAIKQNESFVKQNQNAVFNLFSFAIFWASFCWKPPSELDLRFQRYGHFSVAQSNEFQRKLNTIIGYISKSILATNDSFSLITSHIIPQF